MISNFGYMTRPKEFGFGSSTLGDSLGEVISIGIPEYDHLLNEFVELNPI